MSNESTPGANATKTDSSHSHGRPAPVNSLPRSTPWTRQARAFATRTLRELFRNRAALVWGLAAPVFFFLVFGVALGDPGIQRGTNAVVFGVFGSFSVSLVIFATALTADLKAKRYRKLRSLPISPSADVVGRFLGGLSLSIVSFVVVLLVGVATGGTLSIQSAISVPVVLLSLLLFCLLAMGAAVVVASFLDDGEYVVGVTNMLTLALFFLTGYNGLLPGMAPGPIGDFVNVLPNSLASRLAVYHLVPVGSGMETPLVPPALPTGWVPVLILVGYAVLGVAAGSLAMRRRIYEGEGGE
ncbi:ABC transporter permease [Haloarchaeobius amylolyticus]|uniref:ABC transporter permease n=1 Tax=Haloarchaeobius amylolyticus TaxID=1198296 RepID=UPI00227045C8|nr:ABC transporter permease [Haloarchaeobius amylolyticus]